MQIEPFRLLVVDLLSLRRSVPKDLIEFEEPILSRLIVKSLLKFKANSLSLYGSGQVILACGMGANVLSDPPRLSSEWPTAVLMGDSSPFFDYQLDEIKTVFYPNDTFSDIEVQSKDNIIAPWIDLKYIPQILGIEKVLEEDLLLDPPKAVLKKPRSNRTNAITILKKLIDDKPIKNAKQLLASQAKEVDVTSALSPISYSKMRVDLKFIYDHGLGNTIPDIIPLMQHISKQDALNFLAFTPEEQSFRDYMESIKDAKIIAFDTETTGLDIQHYGNAETIGVSLAADEFTGAYIPVDKHSNKTIEGILQDPSIIKVAHNLKFDLAAVKHLKHYTSVNGPVYDTMIAAYLLGYGGDDEAGRRGELGLKALVKNLLGYEMTMIDDLKNKEGQLDLVSQSMGQLAPYAANDALQTLKLWNFLEPLLHKHDLWDLFLLEMDVCRILLKMEETGVYIHIPAINQARKEAAIELETLKERIYLSIGNDEARKYDIDSVAQLKTIVFGILGLKPIKSSPGGSPALTKEVMEKLVDEHPAIALIQEYRSLNTVVHTYLDQLPKNIASDGRYHTAWQQTRVVTGRLSCVPDDTQILTRRGWKNHTDLIIGEEVLGYNILNNRSVWTKLKNVHTGEGELFNFRYRPAETIDGRSANSIIQCTSNHKWVGEYVQTWNINASRTSSILTGLVEAKKLPKDRIRILLGSGDPVYDEGSISEEDASLIGWIITDGFLTQTKIPKIVFGVKKKSTIEALNQLLGNFTHKKFISKTGVHSFTLPNDQYEGLKNRTGFIDKNQDLTDIIMKMSAESREAMWWAMMEADGSCTRNLGYRFGALDGTSSSESFLLLSTLLGKFLTCSQKILASGKLFNNFHVRSIHYSNKTQLGESLGLQNVWCPETETGTWFARFGNKVVLTGNSKPNLMSIPATGPGKIIRSMFRPRPGYVYVAADFSQLEIRVIADYMLKEGDRSLAEPFFEEARTGEESDIYTTVAAELYDTSRGNVDAEMRRKSKVLVLGTNYGLSDFGFARRASIPLDEAKEFQGRYFAKYPGLKKYMNNQTLFAKLYGESRTLLNRRRLILDANSDSYRVAKENERWAINMPIQGSASDVVKTAMNVFDDNLILAGHDDVHIILQVHDEIIVECPQEKANDIQWMLKECMEGAGSLCGMEVPLRAVPKIGKSWQEVK